jgi:hypothetical protein
MRSTVIFRWVGFALAVGAVIYLCWDIPPGFLP